MLATLVAIVSALALLVALPVTPAAGQLPDGLKFEVDPIAPATGPVGTPIRVSGTCLWDVGIPGDFVLVGLYSDLPSVYTSKFLYPDDDGNFAGYIVVPLTFPTRDAILAASCFVQDQGIPSEDYNFLVTDTPPISAFTTAPGAGPAGTTVTVEGRCEPGDRAGFAAAALDSPTLHFTIDPAEFPLDPDGDFTGSFVIPTDAIPGDYTIGMGCVDQSTGIVSNGQAAAFVVQAPVSPTTTSTTLGSSTTSSTITRGQPVTPRFAG